jgi:ferrochelatase
MTTDKTNKDKTAVILYNLGGVDSKSAVKPFLFNLFYDRSIIDLQNPFRFLLAKFISKAREKKAIKNYEKIGGKSPLLKNTIKQRDALQKKLGSKKYKVFVCMNFWHPMVEQVTAEVLEYNPSKVVLLPLYPQFSTTTTGSFLKKWNIAAEKIGLKCDKKEVCCYYSQKEFILAYSDILKKTYKSALNDGKPLVIFVAHGLPQKIVDAGDPYKWQVKQTVSHIVKTVSIKGLEHMLAYQSRVGPMAWIKPYADEVILNAAKQGKNILLMPISFVSEHVETLVELDIEYKELAMKNGAKAYHRAQTVGDNDTFVEGLQNLVNNGDEKILCPKEHCKCYKQSEKL